MSYPIVLTPEQEQVLDEIGLPGTSGGIAILLRQREVDAFCEDQGIDEATFLEIADTYDCAGEADTWLDIAYRLDHSFYEYLREELALAKAGRR